VVNAKSAFTLIELIFAIVIIAISVVSLPMMNQTISKGIDESIVQEAIFAAATELNEVITANWDDRSVDTNAAFARVIDDGSCRNNPANTETYRRMPGHISQPLHRRCLDSNNTNPANSNTDATITSLDDMAHGYEAIFINDTTSAEAYKKKYTSKVVVSNSATFAGLEQTDNMKSIVITVKDSDKDKKITELTAYSANIGEVDYFKRTY